MFSKEKQLYSKGKPSRRRRGEFSKPDYQMALDEHSKMGGCFSCGKHGVEMHHVVFKSQGGRGKWRNAIPLCREHHELAHTKRAFNESLKMYLMQIYGVHYFKDEWDLYEEGLIEDPTKQHYEVFWKNGGDKWKR